MNDALEAYQFWIGRPKGRALRLCFHMSVTKFGWGN